MNWNNLKSYTCPKDGKPLKDIGHYHACTECVFSINKIKFDSIVSNKYQGKPQDEQDNLARWNNDGREELSEGFLD